jgi:hypothetical protein
MEAVGSSETLVPSHQATQHQILEDGNLHIYRYENLNLEIWIDYLHNTKQYLAQVYIL